MDKILQRVKITLNSVRSGTEFQCLALMLVYLIAVSAFIRVLEEP